MKDVLMAILRWLIQSQVLIICVIAVVVYVIKKRK